MELVETLTAVLLERLTAVLLLEDDRLTLVLLLEDDKLAFVLVEDEALTAVLDDELLTDELEPQPQPHIG